MTSRGDRNNDQDADLVVCSIIFIISLKEPEAPT